MSGLALVMSQMGFNVSGCDMMPGETANRLRAVGLQVEHGHDPSHIGEVGMLIKSAAIPDGNSELKAAVSSGIPILTRAEALGILVSMKRSIAITGTHGKTTTSSMTTAVLETAGLDPTALIGGDVEIIGGNAKLGASDLLVAEACEAYGSFFELHPWMAVVTNIEHDHHDYYPTMDDVLNGFRRFLSQIRPGGTAVLCADDPHVMRMASDVRERVVTYGISASADYRAVDVDCGVPEPTFRVMVGSRDLGEFKLLVPGQHNVLNALAAIVVGSELGVDADCMREALAVFSGAGRRFDVLGDAGGITVVDDYAHHPTEVRATLQAARSWGRRVVAVFQPHLYSRTLSLASDFADALVDADVLVLMEIYAAREKPVPGVSASMISDMVNLSCPKKALFVPDKNDIVATLSGIVRAGDLVVFMGAGDISSFARTYLENLRVEKRT